MTHQRRSFVFGLSLALAAWLITTSVVGQVKKVPAALLRKAEVTLTDAQIKALPTAAPLAVVSPVGAGKVLIPSWVSFSASLVTDYTNVDSAAILGLHYHDALESGIGLAYRLQESTNGGVSEFLAVSSTFPVISGTYPVIISAAPGDQGQPIMTRGVINSGLFITAQNGAAGDFTGGNAANTLKIVVYYTVVDL